MYDKNVVCDKYLNRGIPLVRLDEKFIFFTQIINDLENVRPYYDIKSIRINLRPLIQAIIEHAVAWRNTLGNMLSDRTSVEMVTMNGEFKVNYVSFRDSNGSLAFTRKYFLCFEKWINLLLTRKNSPTFIPESTSQLRSKH